MTSHRLWAVTALLVSTAACTPRSRHDDTFASETQTTGADLPAWTKVTIPPPPSNDLLRPTREEREADTMELSETANETKDPSTEQPTPLADSPLPDWVPTAGRLTVVGASDLARNLGMVDELDTTSDLARNPGMVDRLVDGLDTTPTPTPAGGD